MTEKVQDCWQIWIRLLDSDRGKYACARQLHRFRKAIAKTPVRMRVRSGQVLEMLRLSRATVASTDLPRLSLERKMTFLALQTNIVLWLLLLERCNYFPLPQAGGAPLSFSPGFGLCL